MAPSGSHLSKKTARKRAREYKHAEFYEDGGVLFCRACARAVDHLRKSTIDKHIESNPHRKNFVETNTPLSEGTIGRWSRKCRSAEEAK
ncbi:hypothetical protein MRX96_030090 [Rhipicephalus microplus]